MKKFLITFVALILGMSFQANATSYTNCGDSITAANIEVVAGAVEYTEVTLYLTRQTSPDFTNIQFDLVFPGGLRPVQNSKKKWQTAGADIVNQGTSIIIFKSNFDNLSKYPHYTYVGSNMTNTPIEATPAELLTFYVKADADMPSGTYELKASMLKYNSANGDDYATSAEQVVCTVTVFDTATALENTAAEVKATKFIENGQVVILRDGKKYNLMGAEL